MELTQERLKEVLHYCPETGVFTRIKASRKKPIGDIAGYKTHYGYLAILIDGNLYKSHRLAWLYTYGYFPKVQTDHINGIRDDNRIQNLREATHCENNQNIKKAHKSNKSTGLLGAHFDKRAHNYQSRIRVNRKQIYLGSFKTPQEAHQAYLTAKRQLHEFNTL